MLSFAAGAAEACSRAMPRGADSVIHPGGRIEQALADAAILAEVNYHRCQAGLRPLEGAAALRKVAGIHADWMARAQTLSHRSKVSGQTTPAARLRASGLRFRAGSENVGVIPRFQFGGRQFRIADPAACGFVTRDGQRIAPHSYASLARTIVDLWMGSSGHRRNILDRKVLLVGSAVGFDPKAKHCGRFFVSQSFAG